jgi:hypothetical protein
MTNDTRHVNFEVRMAGLMKMNVLRNMTPCTPVTSYERFGQTRQGGYTFVTLPRIITPYRDSVDGTRDRVTY